MNGLSRRKAIRTIASGAVGAAAGSAWVESLCALARQQAHAHAAQAAAGVPDWKPRVLSPAQNDVVVALTELIIPETDTPGAKGTLVNRFIDSVLHEASAAERSRFLDGLAWVDRRSRALFKTGFTGASPGQQAALLTRVSASEPADKEDRAGADFFRAIKTMTINGYYTTEIGLRRELGDNGQLFLPQFQGCDHPEHQG